jgi:hypothetical protein
MLEARGKEANPMKRIGMAVWFWLAAAMALMAQSAPPPKAAPAPPVIKCKNVDGKGCTYRQVQALSDAVFAGKTQHEVLLPVKDLALASSDGTLRCAQSDGTVCTTPELDIIKEIAAGQQLSINYKGTKPDGAK